MLESLERLFRILEKSLGIMIQSLLGVVGWSFCLLAF